MIPKKQFLPQKETTSYSVELEALAGLNHYSIAHHFRVCYGTSPYRYLMMRRLAEARRRKNVRLTAGPAAAAMPVDQDLSNSSPLAVILPRPSTDASLMNNSP